MFLSGSQKDLPDILMALSSFHIMAFKCYQALRWPGPIGLSEGTITSQMALPGSYLKVPIKFANGPVGLSEGPIELSDGLIGLSGVP
jgi:hypothetical protein